MSSSWELIASTRANAILDKIPLEWRLSQDDLAYAKSHENLKTAISRFLSGYERKIVKMNTMQILEMTQTGQWRVKDVVEAHCKIACIAHQINPCLLNIMIPEAIEKAQSLDRQHENNTPKGVLHGLPVSLKDQFHVKGSDTTMGYVGWIGTFEGDGESERVGKVDSDIVAQLESMGAVVFCKTSLPQTLLYDETINNIIGQTLNPISMHLSCGGSSGGEAALISMGGSSIGLGTDIAGSVRVPAAFCGIYGIKPSSNRFSYRGVANTNPGQTLIPSVVGFLSNSIIGLEIIMSVLFPLAPGYRGSQAPLSWSGSQCFISSNPASSLVQGDRLKFGIMWCDGMVEPHPPVRRGLQMVVEALRTAGNEVVVWEPPSHSTAARIHPAVMYADGHYDIQKQLALSGEPILDDLKEAYKLKEPISVLEYQDLALQIRDYREAYADYWDSTVGTDGKMVDAVLMPVAPHAAVIPGKWVHLAYTEVINVLDYTSLVIPVTHANKEIDIRHPYVPRNVNDCKNWNAYDRETYHGAPVGIQIVGRLWEEEKVIGIGKYVEMLLNDGNSRDNL